MGYIEDIGHRIRVRMQVEKTNARRLAQDVDVHANTLGKILSGKIIPGIDKIINIAAVLNVSTDWLIYGKDGYGRNEFGDLPTKDLENEIRKSHIDQSVKNVKGDISIKGGVHATIDAGTVKLGHSSEDNVDQSNVKEGSLTIDAGVEFPFPLTLLDDPTFVNAVKSISVLNRKQRKKLIQIINTMFDLDV